MCIRILQGISHFVLGHNVSFCGIFPFSMIFTFLKISMTSPGLEISHSNSTTFPAFPWPHEPYNVYRWLGREQKLQMRILTLWSSRIHHWLIFFLLFIIFHLVFQSQCSKLISYFFVFLTVVVLSASLAFLLLILLFALCGLKLKIWQTRTLVPGILLSQPQIQNLIVNKLFG